jgi:peptidoglycan/xylan/chitin deacetylase (PgdA/CDA1 family)
VTPYILPARYRGFTITRRHMPLSEKIIALTFDDGPNAQVTPSILQTLGQYKAQATFFVMGQWAQANPRLIEREAEAGHAIESHSYSHPSEEISFAHAERELERTATAIEQTAGQRPQIFRPPFGRLDCNLTRVAIRQGYCIARWTICSSDKPNETVADLVRRVTENPMPGDIVLLHDGRSHFATAKALPEIMRRLQAKGFRFVTVPELLRMWDVAKAKSAPVRTVAASKDAA